ncbi:MAG: bile acid:sodium symporter [Desulfobacterales bacterium]
MFATHNACPGSDHANSAVDQARFPAQSATIAGTFNFGIIPFVAFGLGKIFFKDQPFMALGLLMAGLVPTSGMTISWTGFAKGNVAAAVKMTVIGLTLGSIATPFYVRALMGAALEVDIPAVMKQIAIIVFIPMIAGFFTQRALVKKYGQKEFQSRLAPRFPAISTMGVLGIVFIAMALKAKAVAGSPQLLLAVLAPLVIIYATDLSETARHAVRYACSMGHQYGAEVNIVHVVPDILEVYASETGVRLAADDSEVKRKELNQQAVDEAFRK